MARGNTNWFASEYCGGSDHEDGNPDFAEADQAGENESPAGNDRTTRRNVLKMFGAGGPISLVTGSSHTGLGTAIPLAVEEDLTHKVADVPVVPSGQAADFGYEIDQYKSSTIKRSGPGVEAAATSFAGLYEPTTPERDRNVPTASIAMLASPMLKVLPAVPPLNPLAKMGIDQILVDYANELLGNLGVADTAGNVSWLREPTNHGFAWGNFLGGRSFIKRMVGILDGDPPIGVLLHVVRKKNVGSDVVFVLNGIQRVVPEDANPDQITLVHGRDESGLFHEHWADIALRELTLMLPLVEMADEPPEDVETEEPEQTEKVLDDGDLIGFGRNATGPIVSFTGNWRGEGETLRLRVTFQEAVDGELPRGLGHFDFDIEGPGGSELIKPNPITGGAELVPSGGYLSRNSSRTLGPPLFQGSGYMSRRSGNEGGDTWEIEFPIQKTGEYIYRLSMKEHATGTGRIWIEDWVTYQGEPAYKNSELETTTEAGEPTGLVLNKPFGFGPNERGRVTGTLKHDEFDTRWATIQIRQIRSDDPSEGLKDLNLQIRNPSGDELISGNAISGGTDLIPTGDRRTADRAITLDPPLFEGETSLSARNTRDDGQYWEVSFPIRETGEHTFRLGWSGDSFTSLHFRVWDRER